MAYYPSVNVKKGQRVITDTFAGYDHRLRIPDGEWYAMKNLTADHFPLFSVRKPRGGLTFTPEAYGSRTYKIGDYCTHDSKTYRCTTDIDQAEAWTAGHWTQVAKAPINLQAIIAKDALYWVDEGVLYANGYATGLHGLQTQQQTHLVSMGAYICVFPDKKYINTMNLTEYGNMGATWTYTGDVTYSMCHQDGTIYSNVTKGSMEPINPANGAVWIDTVSGTVKEYSLWSQTWVVLETVYTRLDFTTMGQVASAFKEYDGIRVSGSHFPDLNGSKIIYAAGGNAETEYDYVVLIGIQEEQYVQESAEITLSREIPDLDYVCECQNRLWGCFYGNDGTQNLNEIYCCALGDFRNWEQYLGVSTDSWRGSIGSDGEWTGCANYLGAPTFFKENVIHPVAVSSVGAHQVGDIPARGVQKGSHDSIAVVNETLYYKSRTGIMAYQGGMPSDVSSNLGDEMYYDAAAGAFGQKYYISMKDSANKWNLFCMDVGKGVWMREDDLHVECFTKWDDELYAMADNSIIALNGTTGEPEGSVDWYAESGLISYEQSVKGYGQRPVRYISRFNIRANMERGSEMRVFIEYDSSGLWTYQQTVRLPNTGTTTIPVRPRRCDHMRLRLEGRGDVKIYQLAKVLAQGSDV